ncbi:MAG: hypothetical protein ACLQBK_16590 [Candidatus Sulfotelmatobacter sp.]
MPGQPSFLLTKWYLDCVADNGDTAIVYVADLRWDRLSLHYASLLTALAGRVDSTSSLRKCFLPQPEGDTVRLSLPHLGIEGTWRALSAPLARTVFESPNGSVDWRCHQPRSQVDLLLHGKTRLTGLGYSERLTLTVLPWKLPLEELHWGRFLSPQHTLVWIDWCGPYQWRTVIHNGDEQQVQSLTESGIIFAGAATRLDLDRGMALRSGQLGETVFAGISSLARLLPRSLMSVEECKWRSRGVLQTPGCTASGWAIHEVVKWK